MSDPGSIRDLLRGVDVFPPEVPHFAPEGAPAAPVDLFVEWLRYAVTVGVPAPHAVTLSTLGADGVPDARVVILRDANASGWQVASTAASPKGIQLEHRPAAALTFFWPAVGRQIRVRGRVTKGSAAENDADFQRRHPSARALVLAGRQSESLPLPGGEAMVAAAVARSAARMVDQPRLRAPAWTVFTVVPDAVEFWQANPERRHLRLRYLRVGQDWAKVLLWP